MAKITLPYTIQNGNTADGGQVQQDFDAILAQVNGNLDSTNLASGAVTLAKLASDVKVIEQVYSVASSDWISSTGSTITLASQSMTLSVARYCLFLVTVEFFVSSNDQMWAFNIYDGATKLRTYDWNFLSYDSSSSGYKFSSLHYFSQLTSGSHTINLEATPSLNNTTLSSRAKGRLTIIQFNF